MEYSTVIQKNRKILDNFFSRDSELEQIRRAFLEDTGVASLHPSRTVVATGHQPVIFYPGLFFKNFFTNYLAEQTGTKPVNFLVDTDVAGYEVPIVYQADNEFYKKRTGLGNHDSLVYSAFEPPERDVHNFIGDIDELVYTLTNPKIGEAFRAFKSAFFHFYNETKQFVETINYLRDDFQQKKGLNFNNFFVSSIAGTAAYARYVFYIIEHIETFHHAYNKAIKKNSSGNYQPVKFLNYENEWYELPFWLLDYGQRHAVSVKKEENTITFFSASAKKEFTLDRYAAEEEMLSQMREALTLYPKATTLTLMIRLFLCDIFVHGTGALEYEAVNNDFLKLFFSMEEPPAFYTATGDIYLPLTDFPANFQHLYNDYKKKQHWLKQVKRDPEEFIDGELAQKYKKQKKELAKNLQQEKDSKKRKEIHRQLESINEKMLTELEPQIHHVNSTINYYRRILDKKHVFYERTYPYFLYPEGYLSRERFEEGVRTKLIEGR
ncbi:MAG: hypothetical protein K9I74_08000 [Bacteroidales bacterium]|nr:hypothetical protein [Bacteroidales bacterium]